MKTLRETIDQLDEISRRGFLKGAGAAAVAGATGGATASSHDPNTNVTSFDADDINIINKFLELYWLVKNDLPVPPEKKSGIVQEYQMIANQFTRQAKNGKEFLNSQWSIVNRSMNALKQNNPQEYAKKYVLLMDAQKIVSDFKGLNEFNEGSLEEASPDALAKIDQLTK